MNTDPALTLGQQLAQMLGSLWSQAKLGLEVGLDAETQTREHCAAGCHADHSALDEHLSDWAGRLTSNGLGTLDVGHARVWPRD